MHLLEGFPCTHRLKMIWPATVSTVFTICWTLASVLMTFASTVLAELTLLLAGCCCICSWLSLCLFYLSTVLACPLLSKLSLPPSLLWMKTVLASPHWFSITRLPLLDCILFLEIVAPWVLYLVLLEQVCCGACLCATLGIYMALLTIVGGGHIGQPFHSVVVQCWKYIPLIQDISFWGKIYLQFV